MTLDQLTAWAEKHGIPGDKHLSFGVAFCNPGAVRFDLAHDTIVLIPSHEALSKVRQVSIDCRCTPVAAREVLESCNWNVPLAITTYLRISNAGQGKAETSFEARQGSEETRP